MLRLATEYDEEQIIELFHLFRKETGYEARTGFEKFNQTLSALINDENSLVLVVEDGFDVFGFFIGTLATSPFCDDLAATELAWFIREDKRKGLAGLKMLQAYELWATNVGADHITMMCVHNIKDLGPFYEKMGYKLTESTYHKRIF